jgi:long-chain acyl-CoA synthetase
MTTYVCIYLLPRPVLTHVILEWLISDLALALYSIPTITVASPNLIAEVLVKYPPNAILVQVAFLPHLLELLTENDSDLHVIVVGDKTGEVKKWEGKVKVQLLTWEKVESVVGNAPTPVPPSM